MDDNRKLTDDDVKSIVDELLAEYSVFPVKRTEQPLYDPQTEVISEAIPQLLDGYWTQVWVIRNKTAEEIAADIAALQQSIADYTQLRLDDFARTRNYDGILSACTYATSTVQQFKAEGQYCVDARDRTWAKLYEIMQEVQAGLRPVPNGYSDIEPELPVLEWPQ